VFQRIVAQPRRTRSQSKQTFNLFIHIPSIITVYQAVHDQHYDLNVAAYPFHPALKLQELCSVFCGWVSLKESGSVFDVNAIVREH
jgi:hypothetical protein